MFYLSIKANLDFCFLNLCRTLLFFNRSSPLLTHLRKRSIFLAQKLTELEYLLINLSVLNTKSLKYKLNFFFKESPGHNECLCLWQVFLCFYNINCHSVSCSGSQWKNYYSDRKKFSCLRKYLKYMNFYDRNIS